MSNDKKHNWIHDLDLSAVFTVIGIILLFSASVIVVLWAPHHVDPSWTQPTTPYMTQIYEVADPNVYISSAGKTRKDLEFVYHLQNDFTLLSFQETETTRIFAPNELKKYVTRLGDPQLKLTSRLLMLREEKSDATEQKRKELQDIWEKNNPDWKEKKIGRPDFVVYELFDPEKDEALALASTEGVLENWVDADYVILDETPKQRYHRDPGVIYVSNPIQYSVRFSRFGDTLSWEYDPYGEVVDSLEQLQSEPLGFVSRKQLIQEGEHIFAISGCWYCHTDQTRTLVQDVVLNGSDSFPAPPSSANEYIYQKVTFPGTRRIGPDLSRVGIKRPSRDWHIGHFWSPKTASKGSIMPAFQHFFDDDPRGVIKGEAGVPNHQFEAIYQYLMTKGTRITPPTEAWWLGKDPIHTIEIIEGKRR